MTTGLSRPGAEETSGQRRAVQEPGALISGDGLTRSQRREIERRRKVLEAFDALIEKGMPQPEAAKELRLGIVTIWRWRQRLEPLTANCGRKTALEKFNPSAAILSKVRKLQLAGMSNADAWHAVADDPRCPAQLREHLKKTPNVSPSLLAATRLIRRKATVIEGPDFSVIKKT